MNLTTKIKKKIINFHTNNYYLKNINSVEYFNMNIVDGCISKCQTCYLWKNKVIKLSYENYKKSIDLVFPYLSSTKKIILNLGGGEPMMNEEVYNMVKLSSNLNFLTSIVTNSMLVTKKSSEELVSSGIYFINMSLESIIPSINDEIRGISGHHKKVLESINYFFKAIKKYKSNCNLGILTTICGKNIEKLPDLIKWVDTKEEICAIRFQAVTQVFGTFFMDYWYKNKKYSHLWPKNTDVIKKVFEELISMKKKGSKIENSIRSLLAQMTYFLNPEQLNPYSMKKCDVYKGVTVHPNGTMVLCPINGDLSRSIGKNILFDFKNEKYNLRLIQKNLFKYQTNVKNCSINNCQTLLNCNFTGDEQKNDPYFKMLTKT